MISETSIEMKRGRGKGRGQQAAIYGDGAVPRDMREDQLPLWGDVGLQVTSKP